MYVYTYAIIIIIIKINIYITRYINTYIIFVVKLLLEILYSSMLKPAGLSAAWTWIVKVVILSFFVNFELDMSSNYFS